MREPRRAQQAAGRFPPGSAANAARKQQRRAGRRSTPSSTSCPDTPSGPRFEDRTPEPDRAPYALRHSSPDQRRVRRAPGNRTAPAERTGPGNPPAPSETAPDNSATARSNCITEAWAEQKAFREIVVFLHGHGVGTAHAVRIFKTCGNDAETTGHEARTIHRLLEMDPGHRQLQAQCEQPARLRPAGRRRGLDGRRHAHGARCWTRYPTGPPC